MSTCRSLDQLHVHKRPISFAVSVCFTFLDYDSRFWYFIPAFVTRLYWCRPSMKFGIREQSSFDRSSVIYAILAVWHASARHSELWSKSQKKKTKKTWNEWLATATCIFSWWWIMWVGLYVTFFTSLILSYVKVPLQTSASALSNVK